MRWQTSGLGFLPGNHLFEITPAQVTAVKEESKHALGDIRKEEQLQEVEDFTCPFAFQHLFHLFIEEKHCLPTWQQIFPWLYKEAAPLWLHPLLRRLDWKSADQHRRAEIWRAVQWTGRRPTSGGNSRKEVGARRINQRVELFE